MTKIDDEQNSVAVGLPLELRVGRLVRCPLCGADKGYTLDEGSTFRWWSVCCADCGQEVSEARAALGPTPLTPPARTAACDAEWNSAGAHAEKLRAAIQRMAACENIYTVRAIASVALHGLHEAPNVADKR